MMDCSEVYKLIPGYIRGELDEETRRKVEDHLDGCADCQVEFDREMSLSILLNGAADDPPEDYWSDYNARLKSRLCGVTGMLWRLGCLPCIILGMVSATLSFILVFVLMKSQASTAVIISFITVALILLIAASILLGRSTYRGLPRYQNDELSLKRLIRETPLYRRIFLDGSLFLYIAMSAGLSIFYFYVANHLPLWARYIYGVVWFVLFTSAVPETYRTFEDYIDNRPLRREGFIIKLKRRWPMVLLTLALSLVLLWHPSNLRP